MIFNVLSWVVFGLIVGAIAKVLMPGADSGNWITTILLGVAGSFVGGYLGKLFFNSKGDNAVRYGGWILSIVGAMLLLLAKRMFFS